jgi:hypothetical protein
MYSRLRCSRLRLKVEERALGNVQVVQVVLTFLQVVLTFLPFTSSLVFVLPARLPIVRATTFLHKEDVF